MLRDFSCGDECRSRSGLILFLRMEVISFFTCKMGALRRGNHPPPASTNPSRTLRLPLPPNGILTAAARHVTRPHLYLCCLRRQPITAAQMLKKCSQEVFVQHNQRDFKHWGDLGGEESFVCSALTCFASQKILFKPSLTFWEMLFSCFYHSIRFY